ncbi:MAG: gluconeogenesis factor YvcK family protein [Acidobacteriota bacterium]
MEQSSANIVVIGGGTGSFTLLQGLKRYTHNITALVNMADDGGSTGQLRDELGVLPPGDVRQCLVALSDTPKVRDLFTYRFDEGSFKGHAFGNLFLTALEKMTGSFAEAVELASEVLNITGRVEPITLSNVQLCSEGADGKPVKGEYKIAHTEIAKRPKIWLEPEADANPEAIKAILEADMVIIAPGNLYGSLAPALVIRGVQEALQATRAKCVYVANLVTKPGPTDGFSVLDFANEIERLAGAKFLDYVVFNNDTPTEELMERYAHDGEYAVSFNLDELEKQHYELRAAPILAKTTWEGAQVSDPLAATRSLIRHDSDAVARQLMRIYFA